MYCIIYLQATITKNVNIENSKRLFQNYLQSPYSFHLNRNPAIISRNIISDVTQSSKHIDSYIHVIREILLISVIFKIIENACEKLKKAHKRHIGVYGAHNEERLTGLHETCSIHEFRYGVSDRGASIRIPMATSQDGKG